jgi:hypothetical protein
MYFPITALKRADEAFTVEHQIDRLRSRIVVCRRISGSPLQSTWGDSLIVRRDDMMPEPPA